MQMLAWKVLMLVEWFIVVAINFSIANMEIGAKPFGQLTFKR